MSTSEHSTRVAIAATGIAAAVFLCGIVIAPLALTALIPRAALAQSTSGASTETSTSTETTAEKQAALESQLSQLEGQIDQYQSQIAADQAKGSTLTGQINTLNAQIAKLNLQIQAINITLQEIGTQITQTNTQIGVTQGQITGEKATIGNLLQVLYENDHTSFLESFLADPQISNLWDEAQNISLFESNLSADVAQLDTLTGQLQNQSQQLAQSQSAEATAEQYAAAQAQQVSANKSQVNQLLAATKSDQAAKAALAAQAKATAAQIRNQIFQLLGGGQLTFEQAYQYAQVASQATGVDDAIILAVLDRESALGQNVGQCSYKTSMSPANIPIFLQITSQLGLDPDNMLVSCANADGVYGGAMGPAQFEPSTWELYVSQIAQITGDNPPSPWSNADAFVATALYLKGAMQGCESVYSAQLDIDRCTAAKYYAGGNWKSYLWTYGEAIVEQEQTFQQDIATITSS
ncbi:MAG TPA: lytic murein transglycosylase [Candidatus Paceibacterota bacterium]|nr:lytic murein transglycosylase [Candidatus Paceibacterota bacterium]